jgi:ABC-type polysaccharide/polyol phosphate export permease
VATTLNLDRLYFKTFQTAMLAPITPLDIVVGEVLAGATKGSFAALLLVIPGALLPGGLHVTPLFVGALLLTCVAFAALGVIVGMLAKTHEDTATYNNFFITPMAFFGGTFFPVESLPGVLRPVMHLIPLTHATRLLRATRLDAAAAGSALVLALFAGGLFLAGVRMVSRYDE